MNTGDMQVTPVVQSGWGIPRVQLMCPKTPTAVLATFPSDGCDIHSNGNGVAVGHSVNEADTTVNGDQMPDRGHWGSKWEFVLSCIGLSVGIGNVWRFPYLAYSNGGGAFLIPYAVLLMLVGKPMYFMEVALGQFSQLGPVGIWKMAPLFTGVGFSMVIVSLIVAIYYNTVIAYSVFYTVASLTGELPWTRCQEWWGADERCFSRGVRDNVTSTYYDIDDKTLYYNGTRVCSNVDIKANLNNGSAPADCVNVTLQTASKQYWEKNVLGLKADGLSAFGDLGSVRWQLVLCFIFSWLVVFLCVMKGVKSSGKVVYFTAIFPYVILVAILVRGVTLDGAIIGIQYFFIPEWSKLADLQVWRKAAEQMFYSLSISWGGLVMFGSYNEFRNKVHVDAFVVSIIDFATSIIAGVATFSILGAVSLETGVDIKEIATAGPGFAFVTFPEAIGRLPVPQLWAVLFFIMLFMLGLDSEFALVETFMTCLYDRFPTLHPHKVPLTGLTCIVLFLIGIPCLTEAGTYVFDLMDTFGGGTGVLLVGIFEMIGIMWMYGVRNFSNDLNFMLGHEPSWYWKLCWVFCSPVLLIAIFCLSMITFQNPVMGPNPYPDWAIGIGWALLLAVILPVPFTAIILSYRYWRKGNIWEVVKPKATWGPGDGKYKAAWHRHCALANRVTPLEGFDNPIIELTEC